MYLKKILISILVFASSLYCAEIAKPNLLEIIKIAGAGLEVKSEAALIEQLRQAIKSGADINAQDVSGMTILHWALQSGLFEVAKFLLSYENINVNLFDEHGTTPIILAVHKNNLEMVEQILKNKPDLCLREMKNKRLILDRAKEDMAVLQGVAKSQLGLTPLMIAVSSENNPIIRALLDKGANPCLTAWTITPSGKKSDVITALGLAKNDKDKADLNKAIQLFNQGSEQFKLITWPSQLYYESHTIKSFLENFRCNINITYGRRIAKFTREGNIGEVGKKFADVDAFLAFSPLTEASTAGDINIVKKLISLNADVNMPVVGSTAVCYLITLNRDCPDIKKDQEENRAVIIKLLIEEGAIYINQDSDIRGTMLNHNIFDKEEGKGS